ncbi:MAG: cytochrome c3 family protein [Desulfobacterales bacterium]|nr:cytochrome c3 family protein [Desulfobacterales bacterium]
MKITIAIALLLLILSVLILFRKDWLSALLTAVHNCFMPARSNRLVLLAVGLCFLSTVLLLYLFYRPPGWDIGPEQPIPFSHRLHVDVKQIQCQFCHPYVDRALHPGIPPVEKCLYCHNHIIAGHPQILKVHDYFKTGSPVKWRKVNYLAEHVLFNHERHIKKEIECRQCHGPIETMDRIKGTYFRMQFCITCHQQKKANLDCWLACHS